LDTLKAVMRGRHWPFRLLRDSSVLTRISDRGLSHPGGKRPLSAGAAGRLFNQPYLLPLLTSLFWAAYTVFGRFSVGDVPPVTLAFIRWGGTFLIVLPFACGTWRVWNLCGPILLVSEGFLIRPFKNCVCRKSRFYLAVHGHADPRIPVGANNNGAG
jgi:hypothetical protein